MKQLFKHLSLKDQQHFKYVLERADKQGMDLPALIKYTSSSIDKDLADIRVAGTTVSEKPEPRPRIVGISKHICPECHRKMMEAVHTDIDNNEVTIVKCKLCQVSKIVESTDG